MNYILQTIKLNIKCWVKSQYRRDAAAAPRWLGGHVWFRIYISYSTFHDNTEQNSSKCKVVYHREQILTLLNYMIGCAREEEFLQKGIFNWLRKVCVFIRRYVQKEVYKSKTQTEWIMFHFRLLYFVISDMSLWRLGVDRLGTRLFGRQPNGLEKKN